MMIMVRMTILDKHKERCWCHMLLFGRSLPTLNDSMLFTTVSVVDVAVKVDVAIAVVIVFATAGNVAVDGFINRM